MPAPPTPTVPVAPAPPGKLVIPNRTCCDTAYDVTFGWTDVSGNDGYRIFRDGSLIAGAGPNATSHVDSPPCGGPYAYEVEACGSGGPSALPSVVRPAASTEPRPTGPGIARPWM